MPSSSARAYTNCLPKKNFGILNSLGIVSIIIGIFFPIYQIFLGDIKSNTTLLIFYLIIILTSCMFYIISQERKKLNRYSDAVLFIHYVNHVVRDVLKRAKNGETGFSRETLTSYFLNQIAECFSITTGKKCRACLKELNSELNLKTIARDTMGEQTLKTNDTGAVHKLSENTDFESIWRLSTGRARYFLCNNLQNLFLSEYKNSTFNHLREQPHVKSFWFITFVTNWKLPYKSTLVIPIRYVSDTANPDERENLHLHQHYWGFLCIDCKSKNVFNEIYSPELGAAFADSLYVLFSQLDLMRPEETGA